MYDFVLEAAIEAEDELPAFATEAPKLIEPLVFYYNMFWDLYRYRRVVAKNDFVPWEVLEKFASKYGIVELAEFNEFVELFRAMEVVYLESLVTEEQQQPEPEANKNGGFLGSSE